MANDIFKSGVIDWVSTKNKALKLMGDAVVYKMTDAVTAIDFKGLGIIKNAKVELKLSDNVVIFIKGERGTSTKTESPKPEPTPTSSNSGETRKIKAISTDKDFIKFEDKLSWFALSDAVKKLNFDEMGIRAGAEVQVQIAGNDDEQIVEFIQVIKKVEPKAEAKVETKPEVKKEEKVDVKANTPSVAPVTTTTSTTPAKAPFKPYNSYDNPEKQNSIEIQSCMGRAVELTVALIEANQGASVINNEDVIKNVEYFTKEMLRILKSSK